jgi:polar amino acid transport system substrate-binding protein
MDKRSTVAAIALLAAMPAWIRAADARRVVRLVAEPFPPLQYTDASGEVRGAVLTTIKAAVAAASMVPPPDLRQVEFMPLRRVLQSAASRPDVIALSVARTPQREPHFQWIGPVSPYELWLYRHKSRRLPALSGPADLRGHHLRFGVQVGANFHEWLVKQGLGRDPDDSLIDPVSQNGLNFQKARLGRIDLFAHPDVSFAYRAMEHGLRAGDFEKVMRIDDLSTPLWAATSLQSDARFVERLGRQLQQMWHSGEAHRIRLDAIKELNARYHLESR